MPPTFTTADMDAFDFTANRRDSDTGSPHPSSSAATRLKETPPSTPDPIIGNLSPGVKRIEVLSTHLTLLDRILLFVAIFFLSYVYTLDNTLRYVYQPNATASYDNHSLLSTVAVVRAVIAAAAQPTAAKIADVFGRSEMLIVSVVFYVLGTIVEATAHNVVSFATGAIIYQIGWTLVVLLVEVLIADLTSLRARLFFSYLPSAPYLINTWVSGDVAAAILTTSSWRWGIAMWAFVYPAVVLPVLTCLYMVNRRAKKHDEANAHQTPLQIVGAKRMAVGLFWQLDIIGNLLLIAMMGCILVPFTLAGDGQPWTQASILVPLIMGALLIPVWVLYEAGCTHPLVPFRLLRDRAVWGALGLGCMLNLIWTLQGDFLYTVTVVAFEQTVLSATRIGGLYSFCSVLTGIITGALVYHVRCHKPFIVGGTVLYLVAFGLLIRFRGGSGQDDYSGLIGSQILLGIAGGLFPYTALASIQGACRHEHVAVITGLFLAMYNVGSALGNAISGAIWRQVLPGALNRELMPITHNATIATSAFGDPFVFVADYPSGTPEREAAVVAYRHTQKLLCITGICLCVPLIAFSLCLRNPYLPDSQSMPDAEKESVVSSDGSEKD